MMKKILIYFISMAVLGSVGFADASAQIYRRENRRAGRDFKSGEYDKALKHYEKGLNSPDVDSLTLLYNKAYVLHKDRRDSTMNAEKESLAMRALDEMAESVAGSDLEYDYYFNRGVIGIDMKDWEKAVDEFKKCILLDPEDMKARENYIYAKEHLKKQQQQQQQQQQQNQDQNQQNQQNQQDQQDQQDQHQPDQNQDQQGQPQESKISPQAAQQILQAMQAKERETQDKVEKKKAAAMKSKQREKNW